MERTIFLNDISKGAKGEEKFCKLYFDRRGMEYKDVSNDPEWQKKDVDFLSENYSYEVKYNYNDDGKIFIEDYTNVNKELGPISYGWIFKSQADFLAVVSKNSNKALIFNFKEMKKRYEEIKDKYALRNNKVSQKGASRWQSAFRQVPLSEFEGLYIEV